MHTKLLRGALSGGPVCLKSAMQLKATYVCDVSDMTLCTYDTSLLDLLLSVSNILCEANHVNTLYEMPYLPRLILWRRCCFSGEWTGR